MFDQLESRWTPAPQVVRPLGRIPTPEESFPQQWDVVTSEARLNAVCCGRQGGKTSGARLLSRRRMGEAPRRVIYATLIRRNCKKLFWDPLKDEFSAAGWRFRHHDGDMILQLENGSWLQALQCSEMADLKTIRGDQADDFLVDECQEPNDDVLRALVLKIALAMLVKRKGRLFLFGTVPEAEPCFFSEKLDDPNWRSFGWEMTDNPHIDKAEALKVYAEAGIGPGHPIWEREVRGKRVKDPSLLAYEYLEGRNDYDPREVSFDARPHRNSIGLDLGFGDHDAITTKSWFPDDGQRRLYTRFVWRHNHLDVDDLAGVLEAVRAAYPNASACGDHGGHGAVKVLATYQNRLRFRFWPKPTDVMLSVGLVNDDYRTGRAKVPTVDVETARVLAAHRALVATGVTNRGLPRDPERDMRTEKLIIAGSVEVLKTGERRPMCRQLAVELGQVVKSVNPVTRKVEINKKGKHSDLTEADRYDHHASRHWTAEQPPPPPREEDWAQQMRQHKREAAAKVADPW